MNNIDCLREALGLTDCQVALRVDREVSANDGELSSHDISYSITSLDPAEVTADELLLCIRDHWRFGNPRFLKDRWWDEDRHCTRLPSLAALMAALNNAAISPHGFRSALEIPVRASVDYFAWCLGLELLET